MNTRHILFILLAILWPIFAKAEYSIHPSNSSFFNEKILFNYYEDEIIERLKGMSSIVPISMNEDVLNQVRRYIVIDRSGSKSILFQSEIYFPLIERLLFDNDLPFQLKNLAALESALNPKANSYAGAAGLWQLMPETARNQGLKVNKNLDERLDPVASTKAAISYIKFLYNKFEDWELVLAAYNCGENKVQSLLNDASSKSYEGIRNQLPRQTQLFVPTFIGVSYMLEYSDLHNLNSIEEEKFAGSLTYVKIDKGLNLNKLYKDSNVKKDIFKLYNPSIKQNEIPKSQEGIYISLPDSMMIEFVDYYLHLNNKNVDTASIIESAYGKLILELISFSRPYISEPDMAKPVEQEKINYNLTDYASIKNQPKPEVELVNNYHYHILRTGESLNDLTQLYSNLSIEDIMKWNHISESDHLTAGSVIIIKN